LYLAVHAAEPVTTKTGAVNGSSNGSIDVGVRPPPVKVQVPFDCCSVPRAPPMLPKVTMMTVFVPTTWSAAVRESDWFTRITSPRPVQVALK